MTETLYHSDIALPAGFRAPRHTVNITYGSHARREAFADRYGSIALPMTLDLSTMRVIEVGILDGRVSKILFRGALDSERDLCIVLVPQQHRAWFAKTVWVNLNSDTHRTLDRSRYVTA